MPRYLLCRPVGGLNDILGEIEICWRYASRFGRTLIIDTLDSGLLDHLSHYLELRSDDGTVRLRLEDDEIDHLAALTILPDALSGRLASYERRWKRNYFIDTRSRVRLTFDFSIDHEAQLLLHQQSVGTLLSIECLRRLRFNRSTASEIASRLPCHPEGYVAVHVRNTDIKTNYRKFFRQIEREVAGKNLLICSDDFSCIAFARDFFSDSNVFTVSDIPFTGRRRLHRNETLDRRKTNIDMFVDLIAMARAETLFFVRYDLWNRYFSFIRPRPVSGFSQLAEGLNQRPELVGDLLVQANQWQAA